MSNSLKHDYSGKSCATWATFILPRQPPPVKNTPERNYAPPTNIVKKRKITFIQSLRYPFLIYFPKVIQIKTAEYRHQALNQQEPYQLLSMKILDLHCPY